MDENEEYVSVCWCVDVLVGLADSCHPADDSVTYFKVTDISLRGAHKSEENGLLQFRYTYSGT